MSPSRPIYRYGTAYTGAAHYLYRWFDAADRLLYVGISIDPTKRARRTRQTSWWKPWAKRVLIQSGPVAYHRPEAEAVERAVMTIEVPVFNVWGTTSPRGRMEAYLRTVGEHPLAFERDLPPAHADYTHALNALGRWPSEGRLSSSPGYVPREVLRTVMRIAKPRDFARKLDESTVRAILAAASKSEDPK